MVSSILLGHFLLIAQNAMPGVPSDWYMSTTRLFEYCVEAKFDHPICPPIDQAPEGERSVAGFVPSSPSGPLTSENLFKATVLYQMKQPPMAWLVGLKLSEKMPKGGDERLWAEAQYLYARVLFDQRKYKEAEAVFDRVVEVFKGKALYHQQRAWVLFFTGKWDRALGSIVSSESSLIYEVPFFEKFFIRALVERETCQWAKAFNTVSKGREYLATIQPDVSKHPWVVLCERRSLGATCGKLRKFYEGYYHAQIRKGLNDLDLVELEMRDRGVSQQQKASTSAIVWPFVGEAWQDELGYYSVPVRAQCG